MQRRNRIDQFTPAEKLEDKVKRLEAEREELIRMVLSCDATSKSDNPGGHGVRWPELVALAERLRSTPASPPEAPKADPRLAYALANRLEGRGGR